MKRVLTSLCISIALIFAGCVDREFDLAKTSSEITVGGAELIIPFGDIGSITVEELLKDNESLVEGENGVYQISFSSFGDDPNKYEEISIDGINIDPIHYDLPKLEPIKFTSSGELPQSFQMSSINNSFNVDIPIVSAGDAMDIEPINVTQELSFNFALLSGTGTINSMILSQLQNMGAASVSTSNNGEAVFDAEISILKELKEIKWVEFGCDKHPYGAPFEAKLDLNGLHDINGSGNLKIKIEFPEGYHLKDENGANLKVENIFEKSYTIAKKQQEVNILFYLSKIDYKGDQFTDGKLKIDDHIKYNYEFNMNLGAGNYNLNLSPTFTLALVEHNYKDIEVKIGDIDIPEISSEIGFTFDGLPSAIKVSKVAFESAPLTLSLKGLEWLEVKCYDTGDTFSPPVEVVLPECMHFKSHKLLKANNTLYATTAELANGITLNIDHIDCNAKGVTQENGALSIKAEIAASIHMEGLSNHTIHISALTPPADFNNQVTMTVEQATFKLDAKNSEISTYDEQSFPLDLGDQIPTLSQSVEIPEMVSSIKRIEIGDAKNKNQNYVEMNFSLEKANSFPVEELLINASVNFGNILKPTADMLVENGGLISKNSNGDYILTIEESWKPTVAALTKSLKFEALENLPPITNGKIVLNQSFPVTGSAKIKKGSSFDYSAISDAEIKFDITMDDIEVRKFVGTLDINVKPESTVVEIDDMGDLEIDINSLSTNPILKINLEDNPTGVALFADIEVRTFDADGNTLSSITIPEITVNERGSSNIIISTERNKEKYQGENYIFKGVDELANLLNNGIPRKIVVDMNAYSNNKEIEIDLDDFRNGKTIRYQYEVIVPMEFNGTTDISYETWIKDLNETFVSIAEETDKITVGDIGLIGVFGSTIPFDVVVSAELVNKNGNTDGLTARLNILNCLIKGCDKTGAKRNSEIDFEFNLDNEGSLEGLKDADGIKLKLSVYNSDNRDLSTLSKDQFIDGKLELRIRNGLTIDASNK